MKSGNAGHHLIRHFRSLKKPVSLVGAMWGNVIAYSAIALMFAVVSGAEAEARQNGHDKRAHQFAQGSDADATRRPPVRGPLAAIMAQFIHACEKQATELNNFPADEIALSTTLDDAQAVALKKAQNIAHETAGGMMETCPPAVTANPADRLDMMERGIDGMDAAIAALLPALKVLYGSLNDEQKAHLVLRFAGLELGRVGAAETTGSASRVNDDEARQRSKRSSDGNASGPPRSQAWWNCEQWQAELRGWPINRVEQSIAVGPRQRAAFYEFAAAVQHAADTLADSCPLNTSVMPIARINDLKKKLDGVRKFIATLRPALSGFYEILDGGQKSRFKDAI